MKISIMGLGWFGAPLAHELIKDGHEIKGTSRSVSGLVTESLNYPETPSSDLLSSEIIILNIPPFPEQPDWFKSFKWNQNCWMIFISSTSVLSNPDSQNAKILQEEEEWIKNTFGKWTILRFAGLIGNGRHPGKSLSGKKDVKGRLLPVNLLSLEDAIGFTKAVIDQNVHGKIVSVVTPEHPTREDFYTSYCQTHNLPLPVFDQTDVTKKSPINSDEASIIYKFKSSLKAL